MKNDPSSYPQLNENAAIEIRIEQVEHLAGKWFNSCEDSRNIELARHCARLHLAAVAEKDVELANLKTSSGHEIFNLKQRLEESRLGVILLENAVRNYEQSKASLEQENRRLVEELNQAKRMSNPDTHRLTRMCGDLTVERDTLRAHLRAVCEAAEVLLKGNVPFSKLNMKAVITAAAPLLAEQPAGKGAE